MKETAVAAKDIQRMVHQIVSRFHPEGIILFGSMHAARQARIVTSTCSS